MILFFNKSVTINNPLRIFFLCGSSFSKKKKKVSLNGNELELEDKRTVFQNFIEKQYKQKNYRSIILEDNFLFGNKSRRHLNYNDINLKSLKSIEMLTSLFSDRVFIIHESFSTAAEIGMFSTSEVINNKIVILTPNTFSVEEDYFSGFMKLAYQNEYYTNHNINTIYYNPGVYNFYISDEVRKLHTYFVDNEIKGVLAQKLADNFRSLGTKKIVFGKKRSIRDSVNNYYKLLNQKKIEIYLDPNDLLCYLISLFNNISFRQQFISKIDVTILNRDTIANRRKRLFNERSNSVENFLKKVFYNTLKIDILDIDKEYGTIDNIDLFMKLSINHQVVAFRESISYFLYILYALSYINFTDDNSKFSISNDFIPVYTEYKVLVNETNHTKSIWSR